jgi:hypothetical protein
LSTRPITLTTSALPSAPATSLANCRSRERTASRLCPPLADAATGAAAAFLLPRRARLRPSSLAGVAAGAVACVASADRFRPPAPLRAGAFAADDPLPDRRFRDNALSRLTWRGYRAWN